MLLYSIEIYPHVYYNTNCVGGSTQKDCNYYGLKYKTPEKQQYCFSRCAAKAWRFWRKWRQCSNKCRILSVDYTITYPERCAASRRLQPPLAGDRTWGSRILWGKTILCPARITGEEDSRMLASRFQVHWTSPSGWPHDICCLYTFHIDCPSSLKSVT